MYRILLVDDEPNVLNALRRELQDDYETESFANPFDALQRCREAQFDLVIADYKMPDMNGIEFLRQFGKLQPHATRLVLSGHADADVLAKAINETHIYRFVSKPWSKAELSGTIEQALAYRRALIENRRLKEAVGELKDSLHDLRDGTRRFQVLVVDDEPNVLSAATRDLTSRSAFQDLHMALLHEADADYPVNAMDFRFDVYTATSGKQALDYARHLNCDIIIADYLMPEMSGAELLEEFRKIQPDAIRILLSGHADKQALAEAINHLEIFSFINKPWREYELKSMVAQAVIYKSMLADNRALRQRSGA